jgi:hypothetical protein
MSFPSTSRFAAPNLIHELINDRIQTMRREAAEQRLILRIRRVQRARRDVRRATARLHEALSRPL